MFFFFFFSSVRLWLPKGMVMEKGQRFTIREGPATVGTGVITELLPGLTHDEKESILMSKKNIAKMEAKKQQAAEKQAASAKKKWRFPLDFVGNVHLYKKNDEFKNSMINLLGSTKYLCWYREDFHDIQVCNKRLKIMVIMDLKMDLMFK